MQTTDPILSTIIEEEPDILPVVIEFLDNLPARLEKIKSNCGQENWEELARTAHGLKSAGLFGYQILTNVAAELEAAALSQEVENIQKKQKEAERLIERVLAGKEQVVSIAEQFAD